MNVRFGNVRQLHYGQLEAKKFWEALIGIEFVFRF